MYSLVSSSSPFILSSAEIRCNFLTSQDAERQGVPIADMVPGKLNSHASAAYMHTCMGSCFTLAMSRPLTSHHPEPVDVPRIAIAELKASFLLPFSISFCQSKRLRNLTRGLCVSGAKEVSMVYQLKFKVNIWAISSLK